MSLPETDFDPLVDIGLIAPKLAADPDLEIALLGAILVEPGVMADLHFLEPSHFFESRHRDVFQRMRALWNEGSSIAPELIADRDKDVLHTVLRAQEHWVSALVAKDYARKIQDFALKRAIIPDIARLAEMPTNGVSAGFILDSMQEVVDKRRGSVGVSNPFDRWAAQGITGTEAAAAGKIERAYIVEDFIREKSLTIPFGAPGEFKSVLFMDLAMCIANGVPWLQPLP